MAIATPGSTALQVLAAHREAAREPGRQGRHQVDQVGGGAPQDLRVGGEALGRRHEDGEEEPSTITIPSPARTHAIERSTRVR